MSKALTLFFIALLASAVLLPAFASPVTVTNLNQKRALSTMAKRIVDLDCTLAPEGQKPDRCNSGEPLFRLPRLPGGVQPISLRGIEEAKRSVEAPLVARGSMFNEHKKRVVDIECTFLPEGEKPARCYEPVAPGPFRILKRTTDNAKRMLDYQCTILPEAERPARCFGGNYQGPGGYRFAAY